MEEIYGLSVGRCAGSSGENSKKVHSQEEYKEIPILSPSQRTMIHIAVVGRQLYESLFTLGKTPLTADFSMKDTLVYLCP